MITHSELNLRTTWSSKRYYEIGLIGFVLGISNSLYLFRKIKELGPDFIIPYIVFNVVLAIPLVILELSLSQYGQKDMLQIWSLCPPFKGIGYVCLIHTFMIGSEAIGIIALLFRLIISSFSTRSGWDKCTNGWNNELCFTLMTNTSRRLDCYDVLGKKHCDSAKWEDSFYQFWFRKIVHLDIGLLQWINVIICFVVSIITFILTWKGLKVIEKAVLWFMILAGLQFVVLFYCSLIHQGSGLVIKFFLGMKWRIFSSSRPWILCAKQVICSTLLGTGGLRTLGSQNKFRGHSYMNGMMIVLVDLAISFFYLLFYLSLSGNMSYYSDQTHEKVTKNEDPEIYAKIPRMINQLNGPKRFWHFFFFFHVTLICFSKILVVTFILIKTIFNWFPRTAKYFGSTCFIVQLILFCLSLPYFSRYGNFLRNKFLDDAVRGAMILAMNAIQATVIIYSYGLTAVDDIHFMLGFRIPVYWQILLFSSPILLWITWYLFLSYVHEAFATIADLTLTHHLILNITIHSPFIITVGYALWYTRRIIIKCKWENVFRPDDSWYLSDPILRKSRQMFSSTNMTKEYLYRQSKRQEKESFDLVEITSYIDE